MKLTLLGGPYSGQDVKVSPFRYAGWRPVPFLVNIWSGRELHCYRTERAPSGTWYLFHRETF